MTGWKCCRAEGPGNMICTERILAGDVTHIGNHVAGGRAEGERDSICAQWPNESQP